jgi:alpha-D-xyloside xylohydrolase
MKDQIAGGINFSMSGTPYWTMDAGGFLVENRFHKPNAADLEEWRELNSRWYQYGHSCLCSGRMDNIPTV